MSEYRYELMQQHATSDKYGNCEICGKFVADVYSQTRYRQTPTGESRECDAFGYKECLIRKRR